MIEKSVYDRVVAVAADYGRMQKKLSSGDVTREQAAGFTKAICAVDHALEVVCEGERKEVRVALLTDIAERRGYERSVARAFYQTRRVFEKRKAQVIRLIARLLDMI